MIGASPVVPCRLTSAMSFVQASRCASSRPCGKAAGNCGPLHIADAGLVLAFGSGDPRLTEVAAVGPTTHTADRATVEKPFKVPFKVHRTIDEDNGRSHDGGPVT